MLTADTNILWQISHCFYTLQKGTDFCSHYYLLCYDKIFSRKKKIFLITSWCRDKFNLMQSWLKTVAPSPTQLVRMSTRDSFEISRVSTTLSSFPGMGFRNDGQLPLAPTEFEREEIGWDGMALCHWGCAGEYLFQKEDDCTVMNLTFSLLEAINTEPKCISLLHDFSISTAKINSLYIQNNPRIPSPIIL